MFLEPGVLTMGHHAAHGGEFVNFSLHAGGGKVVNFTVGLGGAETAEAE